MSLHRAIRTAFRTRLLSLPPRVETGPLTLAVTATAFTRSDGGSFVDDGWLAGDEVKGEGFTTATNGSPRLVTAVTPGTLRVAQGETVLVVTPANPGVTLRAGLPHYRAWESREFNEPTFVIPYIRELLLPAASTPLTIGPRKRVRNGGIYQIDVYSPLDYGTTAQDALVDHIVDHFYPGLLLTANGYHVSIRSSSRSQALPSDGHSRIPISVVYEVYTITPQ